ncbi:MAG: ribonuclease D [Gemmatimonadales bacterium]|nr:ribonuclease D [Gemmatimonadales bacterium]
MPHSSRSVAPQEVPEGVDFVNSAAALRRLARAIRGASLLAVDTEAASFHRFKDRVYLLQVSTRERTAVIDPLAVEDLSPIGAMLADPKIEIVFHDADFDLRLLDRDFHFKVVNVFDTRIGAQFINEPAVGLAALLSKHLGVTLDKKFQRADWSARPLSPEMITYAAMDTRFLPQLRDILRERLSEAARLDWAREEFQLLERVRWATRGNGKDAYLKMKGAKALKGRPLAVLRELYRWRDRTARRVDRAPFRILNNEPLLALAKSPPADLEGLSAFRGVGRETVSRNGRDILKAIDRGLALPAEQIPIIARPTRPPPDVAFDARIDRLKSARNRLARKLELPPGVVCPNGTLEAIARTKPKTIAGLKRVPGVRGWQAQEFGEELLVEIEPAQS